MTTTVPEQLLAELNALRARAAIDPAIGTSASRIRRLGTVVAVLTRAAADLPEEQRRTAAALLDTDTIGHPDQPDTVLGRTATGRYRSKPNGQPLTPATQRHIMDGLADLARAAGRDPYWWQQPGNRWTPALRPWANHTKDPMTPGAHRVLRRALTEPYPDPYREAFRLRTLAALEVLWDTAVEPEGLVSANTSDLADDLTSITLTFDPPGRTAPLVDTVPLGEHARAALRLWLPVRRAVITRHLDAGPDHPANRALFITLRTTTGTYPETGEPRLVPPGLRITAEGLLANYKSTARRLNEEHHGQRGWPVPTSLYAITRGAAET